MSVEKKEIAAYNSNQNTPRQLERTNSKYKRETNYLMSSIRFGSGIW